MPLTKRVLAGAAALAVGAGTAALGAPPAAAGVPQSTLVNAVPSLETPEVLDGTVQALAQVGDVVVLGGTFTHVADRGEPYLVRSGLAAYDRTTNRLIRTFSPVLDGQVNALLPGPDPGTVYVGGSFRTLDGVPAMRLVLLDLSTGRAVSTFRPPDIDRPVQALGRYGDRLYVGGTFTRVGGLPHAGLVAVHARTGALDPYVNTQVSERHNGRFPEAPAAPVGVNDLALTPDGRQMTAIGNFRMVDGLLRDQVVVLDLTAPRATVRPDWTTTLFRSGCYPTLADSWVRDVDYSPDGRYFVIASTGGGNKDLCDTVARFTTSDRGTDVRPTWVASTGGDSVYTVSATSTAVYAGGHFRWFNNPLVVDVAGAGAVPRPGIAALDPDTGLPLPWNPGRHPRDKGVFALLATDRELLLGTDTEWTGDREYYTPRLTRFPLAGGETAPSKATPALPGTLHRVVRTPSGTVTVSSDASATTVGPARAPVPQSGMERARGAMVIGGALYLATSDGLLHRRAFDGTTAGSDTVLDPYNDPKWSQVLTRVRPDETYRGKPSGFERDLPTLTSMFYLGGRVYYTVGGSRELRSRAFEPGTGTVHPQVRVVAGAALAALAGATYANGAIYYVRATDGSLVRQRFDGNALLGSPVLMSGPAVDGRDWRSHALFVSPPA